MSATVVALPGFTRRPRHLQRLADACAIAGLRCVRPALAPAWMPALYMRRGRISALAKSLHAAVDEPFVVVGHSAGAAAACYLALCLRGLGADVRGIVLVDGVDSPNRLVATTLPRLEDVPVDAILAPPSRCNRQGALAQMLLGFPGVHVEVVPGAGHGDIEGAGITVYRRACRDRSGPEKAKQVLDRVMQSIMDFANEASSGS